MLESYCLRMLHGLSIFAHRFSGFPVIFSVSEAGGGTYGCDEGEDGGRVLGGTIAASSTILGGEQAVETLHDLVPLREG